MDLDQLLVNFQKKDVKAFEKLYEMYSKSMHGVIYNIVKDQELAEEVLQDVFLKAWKNSESFSPKKGRFFTWLINIARNSAIDMTRSKQFKKKNKNSDATFFVDIIESDDNLEGRMDSLGIKKFVSSLKEKCKKLIELLYFQGFTQKEASEELKIPLGTVKTNNRNCIIELRKIVLN